jgi:preprotein translocase subunit SecF
MSRFADFGNALYSGERSFDFLGRRKYGFIASIVVALLAVGITFFGHNGFNFGIEFKGGSQFELNTTVSNSENIAQNAVHAVLPASAQVNVAHIGTDGLRIQTEKLSANMSEKVRQAIADGFKVPSNTVASSFVGANWGADVTGKAVSGLLWFVALAAIAMALYFRTLKMSGAALIALVHDLVITAAVYGAFGFEVTPAAVIGFLTILGYSLYDTVVVFDKIRENTHEVEFSQSATFAERVNLAINQTLVRSINTSIVAVLPVAAILFIGTLLLGAGTLRDISLALFIGIIVGTYSTIFIAAPSYSAFRENEPKYAKAAAKVLASR